MLKNAQLINAQFICHGVLYLVATVNRTRVDKKPFSVGRDQTKYEQRTKQNRKELHLENIIMSGENNV